MLLAIDAGNTHTAIALYDGERLAAGWRVATRLESTGDEIGAQLSQLFALRSLSLDVVTGVVIASVVPGLNPHLHEVCERHLHIEPVFVGPGVKTGVRILYENAKDVGADRIANARATFQHHGGPAVVIDFGTAITYDAIDASGNYLGGAIAAGFEISAEALVAHTARLQRVEPLAPPAVIGRTTVAAIQSGLVWGFVSQVEGMVARMVKELGGEAKVIATGTQAEQIAALTGVIDTVDPLLTLEGLRLIFGQNARSR